MLFCPAAIAVDPGSNQTGKFPILEPQKWFFCSSKTWIRWFWGYETVNASVGRGYNFAIPWEYYRNQAMSYWYIARCGNASRLNCTHGVRHFCRNASASSNYRKNIKAAAELLHPHKLHDKKQPPISSPIRRSSNIDFFCVWENATEGSNMN